MRSLLSILLVSSVASAAPLPKSGPPRRLADSSYDSGNWEIYSVDPETGKAKNLTDHNAKDIEPTWSPDGLRLRAAKATPT